MNKHKNASKNDLKKFFDSFQTFVTIEDGSEPNYEGDKPEKQLLFFGCNYEDIPTVVINWSEKGRGFGQYCFQKIGDKLICHNEYDSKETIKRILCLMVDQCELKDPVTKKDNN